MAEVVAAILSRTTACESPFLLSPLRGYARPVSPPRAERRANVAGAIYGQVLVTSFVAALSEAASVDAGEIFAGLLFTMLVFWLAHVYADAVEQRLEHDDPLTLREVWHIAKYEWPMLQATVPALLALSLAGLEWCRPARLSAWPSGSESSRYSPGASSSPAPRGCLRSRRLDRSPSMAHSGLASSLSSSSFIERRSANRAWLERARRSKRAAASAGSVPPRGSPPATFRGARRKYYI